MNFDDYRHLFPKPGKLYYRQVGTYYYNEQSLPSEPVLVTKVNCMSSWFEGRTYVRALIQFLEGEKLKEIGIATITDDGDVLWTENFVEVEDGS